MSKSAKFVDQVTIQVAAGNGGNGVATFRREKYVAFGGPSGGDGGHGGSVFLEASHDVSSLLPLYYQPHQRAAHGGNGMGKDRYGKCGDDLIIPVPCGTVARTAEDGALLGEALRHGDRLQLAQGGRGGLGNLHFKSSTNRAPRECTPGTKGEQKTIRLELKLISDAGLVGYPNAGKSTLLAGLSDAHPKIAAYPFTTLNPIIGAVAYEDFTALKVADIPGLIDGAHEGVGLGHDFLRHIERTRLLVIVLDMAGVDGRKPLDDYRGLLRELELYNADLVARPRLLVANKMDLPAAKKNLAAFTRATKLKPLPAAAATGLGLAELKARLYDAIIRGDAPRE